jgi:hypothetical protein
MISWRISPAADKIRTMHPITAKPAAEMRMPLNDE